MDVYEDLSEKMACMEEDFKKLDRSAATVHAQVHAHDKSIEKVGYCAECRRMKGTHENEKTNITRRSA